MTGRLVKPIAVLLATVAILFVTVALPLSACEACRWDRQVTEVACRSGNYWEDECIDFPPPCRTYACCGTFRPACGATWL